MKRKVSRTIFILLLIITCGIIFSFSHQPATSSDRISKGTVRQILNVFPSTKNLTDSQKDRLETKLNPIIRKLAHFSIYTLVGIFMMAWIHTYDISLLKKLIISLGFGFFYAMSDEFHQYFIPGRSAEIRDVMIDSAGVLVGILIVLAMISLYKVLEEKMHVKNEKR